MKLLISSCLWEGKEVQEKEHLKTKYKKKKKNRGGHCVYVSLKVLMAVFSHL